VSAPLGTPRTSVTGPSTAENVGKWITLTFFLGVAPVLIRAIISALDPEVISFSFDSLLSDSGLILSAAALALTAILDMYFIRNSSPGGIVAATAVAGVVILVASLPAYGFFVTRDAQLANKATVAAEIARKEEEKLASDTSDGYQNHREMDPICEHAGYAREDSPKPQPKRDGGCALLLRYDREISHQDARAEQARDQANKALLLLSQGDARLAYSALFLLIAGTILGFVCIIYVSRL
jgi:hypothetical protein